uniref:Uncharacterized protein n=1 Tax=Parascaris univalens TaxID=6257 RepID=A0A914ZGX7_PARUN
EVHMTSREMRRKPQWPSPARSQGPRSTASP